MKRVCLLVLLLASACTKAGLGGDNTITVYPQHHGRPINGCTVFIKFNVQDSPGADTSLYDTRFHGDSLSNHIICKGLKKGKYYFYVYGWDTAINQPVFGGLPEKITSKSGQESYTIPISEQ